MNILITAGPTREPLDAVRFISNRSSGKMGYALARAAVRRGHTVALVSGPTALPAPTGARAVRVETAQQMLDAVQQNVDSCDALIMAAAVSDWRPATVSPRKIKKHELRVLPLEPTPDILMSVAARKERRVFVGFAAETDNMIAEAKRKLSQKGLDLIVANDVSRSDSGFGTDTNQAVLISADGQIRELPLLTKDELADRILAWVEEAVRSV